MLALVIVLGIPLGWLIHYTTVDKLECYLFLLWPWLWEYLQRSSL